MIENASEKAAQLDKEDPLKYTQEYFQKTGDGNQIYFCGNSLGLPSKFVKDTIKKHVDTWTELGVEGHHVTRDGNCWFESAENAAELLAKLVGAEPDEVACTGTLTVNLHMLMFTFYKPNKRRYKIMYEVYAFPSDTFAFESQVKYHGLDPNDALIKLRPRSGEVLLREEDILKAIEDNKDSLAVVLMPGIQYYTGQLFNIPKITKYAKDRGIICGWDLAHAVGNVPLALHDSNMDFAVWCNYKYLCSGPGSTGGLFVHKNNFDVPPAAYGWYGNVMSSRFQQDHPFERNKGAKAFQISNSTVISVLCVDSNAKLYEQVTFEACRKKSIEMTAFLEELLKASPFFTDKLSGSDRVSFTIITPSDPEQRGCQLSIMIFSPGTMPEIFKEISEAGLICDKRNPDVIRLAPVPLYNTYTDCYDAVRIFEKALTNAAEKRKKSSA